MTVAVPSTVCVWLTFPTGSSKAFKHDRQVGGRESDAARSESMGRLSGSSRVTQ